MSEFPPCAWTDDQGGLHLDLRVILKHLGVPDTEENRAQLTRYFHEIMRTEYPEIRVEDVP
jgi:hypothetical protein